MIAPIRDPASSASVGSGSHGPSFRSLAWQVIRSRFTRVCAYWTTRDRASSASAESKFSLQCIFTVFDLARMQYRFTRIRVVDRRGPHIISISRVKLSRCMRVWRPGAAHQHQPSRSFPCSVFSQTSIWQEMHYRFTTVCAYGTTRDRA